MKTVKAFVLADAKGNILSRDGRVIASPSVFNLVDSVFETRGGALKYRKRIVIEEGRTITHRRQDLNKPIRAKTKKQEEQIKERQAKTIDALEVELKAYRSLQPRPITIKVG